MRLKELKKINILIAIFSLALNIFYFLPLSINIIKNGGGPFGFGLIILCITFPLNLLIIPAIFFFLPKWKNSKSLIYFNFFSLILLCICFGFLKSISGL